MNKWVFYYHNAGIYKLIWNWHFVLNLYVNIIFFSCSKSKRKQLNYRKVYIYILILCIFGLMRKPYRYLLFGFIQKYLQYFPFPKFIHMLKHFNLMSISRLIVQTWLVGTEQWNYKVKESAWELAAQVNVGNAVCTWMICL
jgi:hypothetical protein